MTTNSRHVPCKIVQQEPSVAILARVLIFLERVLMGIAE